MHTSVSTLSSANPIPPGSHADITAGSEYLAFTH